MLNISTAIPALRPAIIQHNIIVAQITETIASHRPGGVEEDAFIDAATKCIP